MNQLSEDKYRVEKNHLGEIKIQDNCLYGIETVRGVENFDLSRRTLGQEREFVRAFAQCKHAAARANHELGQLAADKYAALVQACQRMESGEFDHHLIVDLLEGSGGTSTNMNINEVLANSALLFLGRKAGDYTYIHPNDDVNRSQSTNDVYPSAMKMAVYAMLPGIASELRLLADAFAEKAAQFSGVLHLGRTCMQDAQPMFLGQVFGGYAALCTRLADEVMSVRDKLTVLPLGGTAIGTGFGSVPGYKEAVFRHLAELTRTAFQPASDAFDAMQNMDAFARVSGELKTVGVSLGKVASDLILLSSGPQGGLGEIVLPAVQAGSSIMPGKINPVIPMSVCQIGYMLVGNDATVAQAVQAGQLEINHYEPVVLDRLFESIHLLRRNIALFREKCIKGIEERADRNLAHLVNSSAVATALVPDLGYARVSQLVKRSQELGCSFISLLNDEGILNEAETTQLLNKTAAIVV